MASGGLAGTQFRVGTKLANRGTARSHSECVPAKNMMFNKSILTLIGSSILVTLLTGCASVLCGPTQSLSINSKPSGAEVFVYDSHGQVLVQKTTPCTLSLDRHTPLKHQPNYVVPIKKDGFAPMQVPLTSCVNKAYFANVLCGGGGFISDPLPGAMWTFSAKDADPEAIDENAAAFNT